MDHYSDRWGQQLPWPIPSYPQYPFSPQQEKTYEEQMEEFRKKIKDLNQPVVAQITPAEIEEFRKLLERAREYDKRNNEPSCELDSKKELLLGIAKALGVEIDFL